MTKDCTAYPYEREILIQVGLTYAIIDKLLQRDTHSQRDYHLIKLMYPVQG